MSQPHNQANSESPQPTHELRAVKPHPDELAVPGQKEAIMDDEQRRRVEEIAHQRKQVQMSEILDTLHELAEPLAGVLDADNPDDEEIQEHFDRLIQALEDRAHRGDY